MMMQRVYKLCALFFFTSLASSVYAQGFEANKHRSLLPVQANRFLEKHFPKVEVIGMEFDYDEIDVRLANGVWVNFYRSGEWKLIKMIDSIPEALIPKMVRRTVDSQFRKMGICSIKKAWDGYTVELLNGVQMDIGANGKIYEQRFE